MGFHFPAHPDFTDAKMANLRNEVERCKKEGNDLLF